MYNCKFEIHYSKYQLLEIEDKYFFMKSSGFSSLKKVMLFDFYLPINSNQIMKHYLGESDLS